MTGGGELVHRSDMKRLSISIYCHTPSRTFKAGMHCRARLAEKEKIKAK